MASSTTQSTAEFRAIMDLLFELLSTDAVMGPRLRSADVPQRFDFEDVDLVLHVRAAGEGEAGNLHWEWGEEVGWEPRVRMSMSSATANRYFQGKESIAMAIARRSIRAGGDVEAALALLPMTKPVFARYAELVARDYPHLAV